MTKTILTTVGFLAIMSMILVTSSQQVYAEPGNTTIENVVFFVSGGIGFQIFDPDKVSSIQFGFQFPIKIPCNTPVNVGIGSGALPMMLTVIDCQGESDKTIWEVSLKGVTCIEGSCLPKPGIIVVEIDIKPGSDPSSVACKKTKDGVPVAIFGADNFDASTINLGTLKLNGFSVTEIHNKIHIEDKNGDEFPDAVLHLDAARVCKATNDAKLKESVDATLTGITTDRQAFEGTGDIRIVNR